uniref:Lipid droplet-associated hydrolase n=1 Tax=Caenorhabditis japonica TaxID=281687 RepID=A0A8R1IBW7_CAEJA
MVSILRKVEWVRVAGKWTKMSIMGTNISEENLRLEEHNNDNRVVILMIPGNPGNEGFYAHFGREVLKNLIENDQKEKKNQDNQYLFYTVSSLNHVRMPIHLDDGEHRNHDRFSLEEQVSHKLSFVKEHLPRGKKLYILGHSIGSYMMLRILPEVINAGFNVEKAVGLFPTIQHMATSPNGKRLQGTLATLQRHDWLTKMISWWVDYLPSSIKKYLVGLNLRHPNIWTGKDGWLYWRSLRKRQIEQNRRIQNLKTKFLHLQNSPRHSMLERLGDEQVTLDEDDCEHAFVISEGDVMARNVIKYFG